MRTLTVFLAALAALSWPSPAAAGDAHIDPRDFAAMIAMCTAEPAGCAPRPAVRHASRNTRERSRIPRSAAAIVACESGGSYTAENPSSTASGRYQFLDSTWNGYGGYRHAADAPPDVQDAKFAEVWAGGKGSHHWKQCGG